MNDYTNLIAGLRNMDLNPCNKAADAIEDLQYRVAELEAKMAQREPVAFEYHGRFSFAHLHENERPLYAFPPVIVRLTERDFDGMAFPYVGMGGVEDYRSYAADVETAALRANGFKVEE